MHWDSPRSLLHASCAWVRTMIVILVQLEIPDCGMVFDIRKPSTFISVLYGMSKTLHMVSHVPTAKAENLLKFKTAPVALISPYDVADCCDLRCRHEDGDVIRICHYRHLLCRQWIRIALSSCSRRCMRGFRHRANSSMLNRYACCTEHCIGVGPEMCTSTRTTDVAWLYMCLMCSMKMLLSP